MIKTPVLILGGHGMLGQDLEKAFAEFQPLVWDRAEMDITDPASVEQKLKELKPGTVINAAAYNAVDLCEEEKGFSIAMKVNGDAPGYLAKTCEEIGATFVQYSTDYVFEGVKKEGYTENDEPKPQSNYARSKRAGEVNTLKNSPHAYVVRTCKLFGMPGRSDQSKKSFVDVMLGLAETRDTLDVVDEEFASPTYTPDLAQQTRVMLEGEYAPGVYHVVNTGACTWYEFAQEIFKLVGKPMTLNAVTSDAFPRPAKRPKFSMMLNTKLPQMRSWQEALKAYLQESGRL